MDKLTRALTSSLIRLDRPDAEARELAQQQASILRLYFPGLKVDGLVQERVQLRARAVVALRKEGRSFAQIAQQLGVSRQWCYALYRRQTRPGDNSRAVET